MRLAVVGILAATCFGASAAAEDALFRFWSHAAVHFPLSPCCTPATYEAGEKGDNQSGRLKSP
jgi:hypothetical protein